jgi:Spy/CpxP family protein refolding chaperone
MKARVMIVVAMLMSTALFAQGHRHGGQHRGEHHADKMKSTLGLTDEQYAKVKSIDEKYAAKFSGLRRDSTQKNENREAMKSLRTERENEIASVLTPEQKAKWTAHREVQKKKHIEKRKDHEAKVSEMKAALALTPEQETKMNTTNEKFKGKLKTWRNAERRENRSELQELRREHEAEVKTILTPEQFEKWKTMRHERKHTRR